MGLAHLFDGLAQRAAMLLAGALLAAACGAAELPSWQALEFEQSGYGLTARSQLRLDTAPQPAGAWLLHVESSVASNAERVDLTLRADSGALVERWRVSSGRDQRAKSYQYLPGHILRLRREPGEDAAAAPAQWTVSSRREIPYPSALGKLPLTDSYALLLLAGRLACGDSAAVAVQTDFNFYRVHMSAARGPAIAVDYTETGGAGHVTGERETRQVTLGVSPLGTPEDDPDFSLFGLLGEITILFDADSGLPLEMRGAAPRIGKASIDLRSVQLRSSVDE